MKINYCDTLVVGGGLAGLRAAIVARQRGLNVKVISLVPVKRSHSAAAQGGMQASLGNSNKAEGDNEDVHFIDTVKGSDWGCDQRVARMFAQTAPKAIRQLAHWGVPWSRVKEGDKTAVIDTKKVTITETKEAHGLINSRDFGGTKKWRTCYTADGTGHSMLYGVANKALGEDVDIEDRKELISLIVENGICYGGVVRDLISGELSAYVAKGTLIATGGYGRLYRVTTNAVICDGSAHATVMEAGGTLGNMEAVQFHPTPIVPSGILLTEGCRGDGGVLRDADGYRFMPDYEPEKKDLASRDVVSRRMLEHIAKGKGVDSPYGKHLWLDISILGREHVEKNLRDIQDIAMSFNGIDPADENGKGWMPVRPAQHYSMGGIRTKETGELTTLKGAYSCGESACWDLHGFNRLGGNSVGEAIVSGMIVGEYLADYCENSDINISTASIESHIKKQKDYLQSILDRPKGESAHELKKEMQDVMDAKVGVFRNGPHLEEAVRELEDILKRSNNISVEGSKSLTSANPGLDSAYRVHKMIKVALTVAKGALDRTESRGAHTREDFPKRDDEKWLKRTITSWANENDTLPTVSYEDLDVNTMEIPPSYRGYGKKGLIIDHPDTWERKEVVSRIKEQLIADGSDRYAIQDALMPYELPSNYKERNRRLGDSGDE
ncbi:MAG: Succinate dehydrogenase flavoprotein subunit (EC [uncultured Campylobacterales bacterium]|uniref:Fumarate reductase flavoprotein subunit n=1 Tax=uncultured Campylobacterales bacterium TaxID=352960 RepID=A0A6S6SBI9_9BACT|nr:MAG: Succinate dehydrogenase flavoprotein subunit (EC [uncultured Campylobacterales bacterium]